MNLVKIRLICIIQIFTIFIGCALITSCATLKKTRQINGISVYHNFPWINEKGKVEHYEDSIRTDIYYKGNQILYHSSADWDSIVNGTILKHEKRFYYFVFTKGKKYGYLYDKYKSPEPIKLAADSFLRNEFAYVGYTGKRGAEKGIHTWVSRNKSQDGHSLMKVLNVDKAGSDSSLSATLILMFSDRFNFTPYSISSTFDTEKGMKLYKIETTNHPRYMKEYNMTIDTIKQLWWMDKLPITDTAELLKYFEEDAKLNLKEKNL